MKASSCWHSDTAVSILRSGGGRWRRWTHTHTAHTLDIAAKNVHSIVSQGHVTNKIKSCISHALFYISDGFVVVLGT